MCAENEASQMYYCKKIKKAENNACTRKSHEVSTGMSVCVCIHASTF